MKKNEENDLKIELKKMTKMKKTNEKKKLKKEIEKRSKNKIGNNVKFKNV